MTNEFDFIDHPLVLLWLKDLLKNEPLALAYLIESKDAIMLKRHGKPMGQSQGFNYWKTEHLGIVIYVYSNEYFTKYQVQYLGDKETFQTDKKMGSYLTSFFAKLLKDMVI